MELCTNMVALFDVGGIFVCSVKVQTLSETLGTEYEFHRSSTCVRGGGGAVRPRCGGFLL